MHRPFGNMVKRRGRICPATIPAWFRTWEGWSGKGGRMAFEKAVHAESTPIGWGAGESVSLLHGLFPWDFRASLGQGCFQQLSSHSSLGRGFVSRAACFWGRVYPGCSISSSPWACFSSLARSKAATWLSVRKVPFHSTIGFLGLEAFLDGFQVVSQPDASHTARRDEQVLLP